VITPTPTVTPGVKPRVIQGLVARVRGHEIGGEVVINLGSRHGVKVGDFFNVRQIIDIIRDPQSNEVILTRTEKIAEIKITEVYEEAAIGKITLKGIEPIEINDLVDTVCIVPPKVKVTEIKPQVTVVPRVTKREIAINQVHILDTGWKITLVSYERLEGRSLRFNFLIENLQDSPADFEFLRHRNTYLLDNLANKYFEPTSSTKEGRLKLIQNMPLAVSLTFPSLQEGVVTVVLYLRVRATIGGVWRGKELSFGPITLE